MIYHHLFANVCFLKIISELRHRTYPDMYSSNIFVDHNFYCSFHNDVILRATPPKHQKDPLRGW